MVAQVTAEHLMLSCSHNDSKMNLQLIKSDSSPAKFFCDINITEKCAKIWKSAVLVYMNQAKSAMDKVCSSQVVQSSH